MRFVMQVSMPLAKFNHAVSDGSVGKKMQKILEAMKPEAAYFTAVNGKRGGYFIVNMDSTSEIPRYAEPWFLTFDASVDFSPVMTPEDLAQSGLEQLGKEWGN